MEVKLKDKIYSWVDGKLIETSLKDKASVKYDFSFLKRFFSEEESGKEKQ